MEWNDALIKRTNRMLGLINEKTNAYLKDDSTILPHCKISFGDLVLSIPMDLAETNDFVQGTLIEFMDFMKETYGEEN